MKQSSLKNLKIIIWLTCLVLLLGLGLTVWFNNNNSPHQLSSTESQQVTTDKSATITQDEYIKYTATADQNILEQLKAIADVTTTTSDYGEFVESINGISGNQNKFWLYYINGQPASVGADSFKPEGGEIIEWKLEAAN